MSCAVQAQTILMHMVVAICSRCMHDSNRSTALDAGEGCHAVACLIGYSGHYSVGCHSNFQIHWKYSTLQIQWNLSVDAICAVTSNNEQALG